MIAGVPHHCAFTQSLRRAIGALFRAVCVPWPLERRRAVYISASPSTG